MLYRTSAPLLDLKGRMIQDESGEPMTLGFFSCMALLADFPDEPKTAMQKQSDGALSIELWAAHVSGKTDPAAGDMDLTVEQVARIKHQMGKGFPTLVVTRAYAAIENPPELPPSPTIAAKAGLALMQ